jgi:hypothetical protein
VEDQTARLPVPGRAFRVPETKSRIGILRSEESGEGQAAGTGRDAADHTPREVRTVRTVLTRIERSSQRLLLAW